MQTANHASTILLSHVLAPGPSKTGVAGLAHYAASGWTSHGLILGVIVLLLLLALWRLIPSGKDLSGPRNSRR